MALTANGSVGGDGNTRPAAAPTPIVADIVVRIDNEPDLWHASIGDPGVRLDGRLGYDLLSGNRFACKSEVRNDNVQFGIAIDGVTN